MLQSAKEKQKQNKKRTRAQCKHWREEKKRNRKPMGKKDNAQAAYVMARGMHTLAYTNTHTLVHTFEQAVCFEHIPEII